MRLSSRFLYLMIICSDIKVYCYRPMIYYKKVIKVYYIRRSTLIKENNSSFFSFSFCQLIKKSIISANIFFSFSVNCLRTINNNNHKIFLSVLLLNLQIFRCFVFFHVKNLFNDIDMKIKTKRYLAQSADFYFE
jgi:hypothetical protein